MSRLVGPRRLVAAALLTAAALLGLAPVASAHPVGASAVFLTVGGDSVDVELAIPMDKLNQATGLALQPDAASLTAHEQSLRHAITSAVAVADASAEPYAITVTDVQTQEVNSTASVVAHLTATPPSGRIEGDLSLDYRLVVDQVAGHRAFVFLVSDLQAGQVAEGGPQPLGTIEAGREHLSIQRDGASGWTGFAAMIVLGAKHIAEGTDHMLFLVTLLLAAPLVATAGRWTGRRSVRSTLLRTLGIVSAFTLGHTTSLALVSFGLIQLPQKPVEVLVAVSILVAAVHAWRPLTGRAEIVVGAVFGLVHGTAFATAILDLGLDTGSTVVAVLGFNAGVELAQLTIVALILPLLLLLATRRWYRGFRVAAAAFSVVASLSWIVAVLTDSSSVLQPVFDVLGTAPALAYGLFASTVVGAWLATRPAPRRDDGIADAATVTLERQSI